MKSDGGALDDSLTSKTNATSIKKKETTIKESYSKIESHLESVALETSLEIEEQMKIKKARCLLRTNDNKRVKWDLFVLILSIWNCYSLPFDIAFNPPLFQETYFKGINNIIDSCFGIDIIINFRTAYLNR
jgi:hypothetical protein